MVILSSQIRFATPDDAEELLRIYTPYVRDTTISFEIEPPTLQVFRERIAQIGQTYPYLVCETEKGICAYAYASRYQEREAYRYDVNLSIYAHPDCHGAGVAQRLYHCLFACLREQGFYNAYAGISVPNDKSIRFHEKLGFEQAATFRNAGYKLGGWHDVIWFAKTLAPYPQTPAPTKRVGELPNIFLKKVLLETQ